jgi:DNA-binding transcriptional regulator YdaS (Cro superfamily)
MAKSTAQTRTLQRALEIAGTMEALAVRLGASSAELSVWLSGERPTPSHVYLLALDVVSRGRPRPKGKNEPG